MKDELISFETAKLAKEKGFDPQTFNSIELWVHTLRSEEPFTGHNPKLGGTSYSDDCELYGRPTQSILQRWLRERHDILVYCIPNNAVSDVWHYRIDRNYSILGILSQHYPTFEDALENGLKEGLSMLKKYNVTK
jgi:hypothetical protein